MVGIGVVGATLIIVGFIMAITGGYIADATHTEGDVGPAALTGLVGAFLMLLGFGSILFRRN